MIVNNILKNDEKNAICSEKQTHTRSGRLCLVSNFYQLRTTPKKKKKIHNNNLISPPPLTPPHPLSREKIRLIL